MAGNWKGTVACVSGPNSLPVKPIASKLLANDSCKRTKQLNTDPKAVRGLWRIRKDISTTRAYERLRWGGQCVKWPRRVRRPSYQRFCGDHDSTREKLGKTMKDTPVLQFGRVREVQIGESSHLKNCPCRTWGVNQHEASVRESEGRVGDEPRYKEHSSVSRAHHHGVRQRVFTGKYVPQPESDSSNAEQ
ncbi:hypothetical protein R3P38DRAFT_2767772 [Favolaschia claudopus]|uniref:Uncharacterized protein n=1 Tax=Favolaschia claudopus TaxID=2862362 RepID=A0AAW0CTA6_9AGAR